jgi:hypothetical protein
MRGRSKLDRVLIKTVGDFVWEGFSDLEIRQRIGVPRSTWTGWIRRGEEETRGIFHEFSYKFNEADALFNHSIYHPQIKSAQNGDLAAAKFLADRHPRLKEYRKRTQEQIESDYTATTQEVGIGYVIASDEELRNKSAEALRRYREARKL